MPARRRLPLLAAALLCLALAGCGATVTLPHSATTAAGPGNPEASAVHGQATTGQFQ